MYGFRAPAIYARVVMIYCSLTQLLIDYTSGGFAAMVNNKHHQQDAQTSTGTVEYTQK